MIDVIRLAQPEITDADRRSVAQVLQGGILSRGPQLARFEDGFCELTGRQHAIGVSSGTAALHLALALTDVGQGDEVITTSYSVPASVNPILTVGAQPVFVDIDPATRALDPDQVEKVINEKTRAILAVHPQAAMADMAALRRLAKAYQLGLIEDACEACGSRTQLAAGAFGDIAAFGFYPNKPITTGEGGMLVLDDGALAARARRLRNHGRTMDGRWLDQDDVGFNYRLSELNAALGVSQLSRLEAITVQRRELAQHYDQQLGNDARLTLPPRCDESSWFCYVIELDPVIDRDAIAQRLAAAGIETGRYFAPLHRQPALAAYGAARPLPITERVASGSLALPLHNGLRRSDIDRVASTLLEALATG